MISRIIFLIIISVTITCCTDKQTDSRLSKIEEMSEIYPQRALDSLTVINFDKLSDTDKEYYDFLWVKTSDKSFIKHTSDSLILNVIVHDKIRTQNFVSLFNDGLR